MRSLVPGQKKVCGCLFVYRLCRVSETNPTFEVEDTVFCCCCCCCCCCFSRLLCKDYQGKLTTLLESLPFGITPYTGHRPLISHNRGPSYLLMDSPLRLNSSTGKTGQASPVKPGKTALWQRRKGVQVRLHWVNRIQVKFCKIDEREKNVSLIPFIFLTIHDFHLFFTSTPKTHVRCEEQQKT